MRKKRIHRGIEQAKIVTLVIFVGKNGNFNVKKLLFRFLQFKI